MNSGVHSIVDLTEIVCSNEKESVREFADALFFEPKILNCRGAPALR